jgi:transcriptional regulator with XRE-family HTH domain
MVKNLKSREVIAANLRALMNKNKHSEGDLHRKTGLSQSTIGRTLKGETATTVDTLDLIAKAYGLLSWQMMIADLDISNPPVLKSLTRKEQEFYDKMKEVMKELQ